MDIDNVVTKSKYLAATLRRPAILSKNKEVKKIFEYKSPNYNDWLIFVTDVGKKFITSYLVLYKNDQGNNAVLVHIVDGTLTHFTGHFFSRYNERFLKQVDLHGKELVKHFIAQNTIWVMQSRGIDENGEDRVFCKFNEGIGLGITEPIGKTEMLELRTFVSFDMLFPDQIDDESFLKGIYDDLWKDINHELNSKSQVIRSKI